VVPSADSDSAAAQSGTRNLVSRARADHGVDELTERIETLGITLWPEECQEPVAKPREIRGASKAIANCMSRQSEDTWRFRC
jgi:hypothetical protein